MDTYSDGALFPSALRRFWTERPFALRDSAYLVRGHFFRGADLLVCTELCLVLQEDREVSFLLAPKIDLKTQ